MWRRRHGPLPGGLVFAHETGHNMGLAHNSAPGGGHGLFSYSFGHRTPLQQSRTIMSSSPVLFREQPVNRADWSAACSR